MKLIILLYKNLKSRKLWQDRNLHQEGLMQLVRETYKKVEKLMERNLKHKSYLIFLKYIPHIIAFMYIIYTMFQFINIDLIILGYFMHLSIMSWLFMFISSIVFKYCYVHRLPLYYIALNDISSTVDYYIGIPVSDITLLGIHIVLRGILIFGYTLYYVRNNKKLVIVDN